MNTFLTTKLDFGANLKLNSVSDNFFQLHGDRGIVLSQVCIWAQH